MIAVLSDAWCRAPRDGCIIETNCHTSTGKCTGGNWIALGYSFRKWWVSISSCFSSLWYLCSIFRWRYFLKTNQFPLVSISLQMGWFYLNNFILPASFPTTTEAQEMVGEKMSSDLHYTFFNLFLFEEYQEYLVYWFVSLTPHTTLQNLAYSNFLSSIHLSIITRHHRSFFHSAIPPVKHLDIHL